MFTREYQKLWCFTGILFILAVAVFIKGCQKDNGPVTPQNPELRTVTLSLNVENNPQAKATGLVVELVGLNDNDEPVGPVVDPIMIETPTYPLAIEVSLYVPPCRYLVTVTTALSREAARVEEGILNMCSDANVDVSVDTFEEFEVEGARFDAPDSAEAGETIDVRCGIDTYEAPDSERASLTMTLSEYKGKTFSEALSPAKLSISGSFPDPYPLTSSETRREFSCTIDDGRSTPQRVERTVTRKVTLCEVINERDSGAGSLRQVLEDADRNRCSGITFASGVSTIRLDSQLEIHSGSFTIDGGSSGVTISGEHVTHVFEINSGTDIIIDNLTITNGQGGTIYNNGTLTVNGAVSANEGDGIVNDHGTLILNGIVQNNTGGGIVNDNGTVTVNGTVSGNCWNNGSSGIYNDGGTLTISGSAKILNNQSPAPGLEGGGIANMNGGSLLIKSGALISGNGNGMTTQQGGGIANGGTWSNGGTVEIEAGAVISNNSAHDGGGIDNHDGTLTVRGIVENNTATFGGGIETWSGATTIITSSALIRSNEADSGAGVLNGTGGTTTISGTVRDNYAKLTSFGSGGGVNNSDGNLTITSSADIIDNTADDSGGGIFVFNGTVTVNGTVSGNTAGGNGGGIDNNDGTVIVNGTVSNNSAGSSYSGGGIRNMNGTLTVNGTVSDNTALHGGGIYNDGTAFINGTIENNTAGGGVGTGGGINQNGGSIVINLSTGRIINNTSDSFGGGLFVFGGPATNAVPATISGNTAGTCNNLYIVPGPCSF